MTEMTAAEFRAIRTGLGVTAEWIADHVRVRERAVKRWESGEHSIKPAIVEAILRLEAEAAAQVAEHVAAMEGHPAPVLMIEDDGSGDTWPAGWQRQIAFRVRQALPALRIV